MTTPAPWVVIIDVFVLSWIGSVMIYEAEGFDRLESPKATTD